MLQMKMKNECEKEADNVFDSRVTPVDKFLSVSGHSFHSDNEQFFFGDNIILKETKIIAILRMYYLYNCKLYILILITFYLIWYIVHIARKV